MTKAVKRAYDSTKRQAQAAATRHAILDAARELFVTDGYTATTMQAVADHAGVAVQTVYAVFKNKRRLLDELLEAAIVEPEDDIGAIAAQPDPWTRARMDAAMARGIAERVGPIARVVVQAATVDTGFAAVYDAMKARRRAEMTASAKVLAGPAKQLRMRGEMAAATLYVLYSPQVADMLMEDYGWSAAKYERWLAEMLYASLLSVNEIDENTAGEV